jgi:hypothetical protein
MKQKPQCSKCKRNNYTGPAYSLDKAYVCQKCWAEELRISKVKNNAKQ